MVQIDNYDVLQGCIAAQRSRIFDLLKEGWNSDRILASSYAGRFFARDIYQGAYKNVVPYLNKQAQKKAICKVTYGPGYAAAFIFHHEQYEQIAKECISQYAA